MIDSINDEIYVFADVSKGETGTRADFFCDNPYKEGSFELNDHNSVFQVEIVGKTECAKWLFFSNQQIHWLSNRKPSVNKKTHCLRLCKEA